ncbi:MAG: four helix bundle protein [Melioribacteraceae bacterium]|nr:MAG: four helix bundle protein [Melioribacteraceae bacterium]
MEKARNFTDLIVWQKAHQLVLAIYKLREGFPKTETYGLTSQIRRAAVSIAANIAEGFKKKGALDKVRFMNISEGSLEEVKYYLILAKDLGYIKEHGLDGIANEVSKLLSSYSQGILRNKTR